MFRSLQSLWNIRTVVHALIGPVLAAASMVLAAMVLVLPLPPEWRLFSWLACTGVLLVLVGLPRPSRQAAVWLANRLLRAGLPAPRPHRWRTGLWALAHALIGTWVVTAWGLLALSALLLVLVWLDGGGELQYLTTSLRVPGGAAGVWVIPLSLAYLLVAGLCNAGAGGLSRVLAGALLGPSAADRAAIATRTARDLARRNRLAHELHDSIGHTLTESTIQAAVANQLLESDPAAARRALDTIEDSSRSALGDLDQVLAELRRDGDRVNRPRDLSQVDRLVEGARQCGYTVEKDIAPGLEKVPAAVSREAYRFVQEGLTNALKYSVEPRIRLRVTFDAKELCLEISNPAPATSCEDCGRGLRGLRERINSLGGSLRTENESGRWLLAMRAPLRSDS